MNRPFKLHNAPPITLEIKYGMKKISKSGKPYPTKLDHFLVVTREKGELNFEIAKDVHEKLGTPKPVAVPIRLLSDSASENFTLFRGMFSAQGVLGCGAVYDDKRALRRFRGSGKDFEMCEPYEVDCSAECPHWQSGKCDISGILYFHLADHLPRSGALGAVRINGTHAQRRIRSSLDIIRKQTGGILANLPLQITIHQEPKRTMSGETFKVPMLSIEPAVSQSAFLQALEVELERRRRLNELRGTTDLFITGVLSEVAGREAIDDKIEVNDVPDEADHGEVLVEEIEGPLYVMPDDVSKALKAMPDRKAEMILNKFSDKSGVPDIQKVREYIEKDSDRKKNLDDELNF